MYILTWILAGIVTVVVGGAGITALGLSFWEDVQQRRERRQRVGS